jgi:hypothetical protein
MRRIMPAITFTLFLTGNALAQSQPTSCSMGAQMCKEYLNLGSRRMQTTVNATSCDKAYADCMKSGVWIGPNRGGRYPVSKK